LEVYFDRVGRLLFVKEMKSKNLLLIVGTGLLWIASRRNKGQMLSKNFSLKEFTKSATAKRLGIENKPDPIAILNLQALVDNVLQPLRNAMGFPITVTSGYRSQELNDALNGAYQSQHMKGQAADIVAPPNNAQMFYYIKDNLPFDQLIWEAGNTQSPEWIHVSYSITNNRKQVLRYIPGQGYSNF
jgi:hypothetical protein